MLCDNLSLVSVLYLLRLFITMVSFVVVTSGSFSAGVGGVEPKRKLVEKLFVRWRRNLLLFDIGS
jgi:hypothetical protein